MKQKKVNELTEHSIEDWCKEFIEKGKFSPMNSEQAEMLVTCKISEPMIQNDENFDKEVKVFGLYQILKKRIDIIHTYTATKAVIMFISSFCSNPAMIVMMSNYLQYMAFKLNVRHIDMDIFCSKVIPDGFPSEDSLEIAWRNQKVIKESSMGSDNMLDYTNSLESIQFK